MAEILKHPMFFTNAMIEKMVREECERKGWTIAAQTRPEIQFIEGDYKLIGATPVTIRVEIEVAPVSPRAK